MRTVYLNYTQEELNQQYDQATLVPNYEKYFALEKAESEKCKKEHFHYADIRYGNSPDEILDIFPTKSEDQTPVIVYFHGGAWKFLTKDHASFPASSFLEKGYSFVSVNYSLTPLVTLFELVSQCKRAVEWVYSNIHKYGGDKERIYVAGHSSGAHVAALMLESFPRVQGGLLISGIFDLEPVKLSARDDYLHLSEEDVELLSPIRQIPAKGPPIVIAYSKMELKEFQRQSEAFAKKWRDGGNYCDLIPYEDLNHFETLQEIKNMNTLYLKSFFSLIKKNY